MSEHILKQLARIPAKSTANMETQERENAIWQMMADLKKLANDDGCIAAAWAFEILQSPVVVAAPQLLEACKLADLNFQRTLSGLGELFDDDHEAWTAIRAAIAAAEGRS